MRAFRIILGVALMALGLLWALQGADVVRIRPILCLAGCEPLVGGSTTWLIAGIVALAGGLALIAWPRRV